MIESLPLSWDDKKNSPELEAYFAQLGKKYYFSAEEINQLRDGMNQMYGEFLANTDFIDSIDLTSAAPVLPGIYIPTVAGTYANYGGLVVDLNNKISRIVWNGSEFRQQVVAVDMSNYLKEWTSQPYPKDAIATKDGKDWIANAATVAGDVPGTSIKWKERLYGYEELIIAVDYWLQATIVGYVNTLGVLVAGDNNWRSTDFIAKGALVGLNVKLGTHPAINSISYYDASYAFISGVSGASVAVIEGNYDFPPTAVYFKISSTSPVFTDYVAFLPYHVSPKGGPTQSYTVKEKILELDAKSKTIFDGKKVVLFGDSRMSNDYNFISSEFKRLTGVKTVLSKGNSGASTDVIATNISTSVLAENPDIVVGLFGGNDIGASGTVGTFASDTPLALLGETVVPEENGTYFIQDVSRIIQTLKNEYYNIRTRALLTGTETEGERDVKIEAVRKVICLILTDLPQKRIAPNAAFSDPLNWERKRLAIIEVCEKHCVPYLDLQKIILSEWDFNLEPSWGPTTDAVNNLGIMTMDGLHPNKYGFRYISRLIKSKIESMGNIQL